MVEPIWMMTILRQWRFQTLNCFSGCLILTRYTTGGLKTRTPRPAVTESSDGIADHGFSNPYGKLQTPRSGSKLQRLGCYRSKCCFQKCPWVFVFAAEGRECFCLFLPGEDWTSLQVDGMQCFSKGLLDLRSCGPGAVLAMGQTPNRSPSEHPIQSPPK